MGKKKELQRVLKDKERAEEWIEKGISNIETEDVRNAIKENVDPSTLIFSHFQPYMENPVLKPLIKMILRKYWGEIEKYLTNTKKIYGLLIENRPEMEELLDTEKGRRWLNYATAASYKRLYDYTWN